MSSTIVSDTPEDSSSGENTVIIIVNDESGNVSVDQEMLQQLLGNQENATLSVVRVNESDGDTGTDVNMTVEEIFSPVHSSPVKMGNEQTSTVQVNGNANNPEAPDPLLDLDQEEIEKIEHALQAEQSGQLFSAELEDLLDPDLTGVPDDSGAVATISLDHCYSSAKAGNQKSIDNNSISSEIDSSDSATTSRSSNTTTKRSTGNKSTNNKRRSQRQIDKIEMETLKRIRAENQQLLKKEKEVLKQQNSANKPKEGIASETLKSTVPKSDVVCSPEQDTKTSVVEETKTSPPISRLATIRQELQRKILPVESPALNKNSSKFIDPFAKSKQPTAGTKDQSPGSQNDAISSIGSKQSVSGDGIQPVRPRRQNRQPPKHLREAFDQMEFEAVTAVALKKSLTGSNSPTKSVSNAKNISVVAGATLVELSGSSEHTSEKEELENSLQDEEDESGEEEEGSESEEGEDDPSKLWCICREPHNNRFMICCDKCEDWFHGSCVGVTRAMGRELENKGLEWICPHCVRAEYAAASGMQPDEISTAETLDPKLAEKGKGKNPVVVLVDVMKSKTQMAQRKVRMSSGSISEELAAPSTPITPTTPLTPSTPVTPSTPSRRPCVVSGCRSEARPSSVYCSDSCIVTHARDSLKAMSREKSKQLATQQQLHTESGQSPGTPPQSGKWQESVEFGQLMSQPSPIISSKSSKNVNRLRKSLSTDGSLVKPANLLDETPVPVMERKTGKVLTGSLAPKVVNLEQWLKENPSFEIIRPASLPKTKTPARSLSILSTSKASLSGVAPGFSATSPSLSKLKVSSSRKPDSPSSSSSSSRPSVKSVRKRSSLDQIGTANKDADASPSKKIKSDPESTRSSAKTSLKDALWNRCKESSDDGVPLVDETTAERVAGEIEEALYCLFNKDVGMKYKAKYRSLIFNIKDTKNVGLYRKIIERQIIPAQLVKMTAEELASEELAEWRERETKHQLDIIQKTELEMMTMSNKYLVKTHKGEEIIEEAGKEQLLLEGERETSGSAAATLAPVELDALQDTTSRHESHLFDLNCRICSGKAEAQTLESESAESRKKKKSSSHQSSSESTNRDRHHKDSHKKKKRDNDKEEVKERRHSSSSRRKEKERSSHSSKTSSRDTKIHSHHHKHRTDKEKEKEKDRKKEKIHKTVPKSDVASIKQEVNKEDFDIISKILSSQELPNVVSTYEVNGETKPMEAEQEVTVKSTILPTQTAEETKVHVTEDLMVKQECTTAANTRTPEEEDSSVAPTWKGSIITSEFGKVNVQANSMSGLNDLADLELPGPLDVVGRIRPEMVWDYVNQTRRAGTRDIIVIQFSPCSSSDQKNYSLYLSHLYKSSRFAVVGNVSKLVKDFYIVPLPKDSPIPLALTSLVMHGRTLDENRGSLLLGVIVRAKKNKRPADNSSSLSGTSTVPSTGRAPKVAKMSAKSQHTPPSSDTSSPSLNYVPTARKKPDASAAKNKSSTELQTNVNNSNTIEDIPYSPGQLLSEENVSPANDSDLLKQKAMLEELNRQIEEQKQELASMSAEVVGSSETDVLIPGLGEPAIPGLDGPSSSSNSVTTWPSSEKGIGTRVTPSSDPPFDHSANAANPTLNLNLSNLQEIISTIQKKELEMKMIKQTEQPLLAPPGVTDRELPGELFSPHDVDMRIAAPMPVPVPVPSAAPATTTEQKKPSLLNQLTDEELLAKAMEMEMEQAGVIPTNPVPFFSPPRGPPGMPLHPYMPHPSMMGMGPPRPFHSPPPYMGGPRHPMGPGPYQHSPPGGFRPRHSHNGKKKR